MSKSITKNAFFNMAYNALTVVFPLFTVSYASRILGASGIGNVSSAQNTVSYFTMFAALGIPFYGVRAIAQSRWDNKECNKTFTELFIINLLSTVVCTLLYFILIAIFPTFDKLQNLHIMFGTLIVCNVFNIDWVYQGFEEYKYITVRSFIIKAISLILLILFVKTSSDLLMFSAIVCFGTIGNYFLNMIQLRKYVKLTLKNLILTRHLKAIMTFFGSVIAVQLYSLIDVTILNLMTNSSSVGYYSNAIKITKTLASVFTAIGAVTLPRLSIYYNEKKYQEIERVISKFLNTIMLFSFPACVGIILTANKIVPILFGNDFLPAIITLKILSPLIIMMPLSGGIFGQLLLITNNEISYFKCVFMGSITNIILNTLLIKILNQNGAALAIVITEGIVSSSMILVCKNVSKIRVEKKNIFTIFLAVVTMTIIILAIDPFVVSLPIILSFALELIIGVIIYFFVLIATRNDSALQIINKMIKRTAFKTSG